MDHFPHIPKPEPRWSWGNLIGFIPLLLIAALWLVDRGRDAETIPVIRETQADNTRRIAVLESQARYTESRYAEIISRLERIDSRLAEQQK